MDSLNWKEVAPGRYERAIDESEEVYVLVAAAAAPLNKEHWSLTVAIKVDQFTTDFVNEVQQAWKTFRYDHPSVATFIEDGKRVYNVAKQDELDSWIKETFVVETASATELYSSLRPVKRATL
jgi:hypothetical protein